MDSWANNIELWKKGQWHRKFLAVQGDSDEWQKVYAQYLKSDVWTEIRLKAIVQAGYRCQRCNALFFGETKLQVHHKTYDRVGGLEIDNDLEVVCAGECHRKADEEREERVEEERGYAIYEMRFDSWGKRVYEDEWVMKKYDDEIGARDEFHRFAYKDWCKKNNEPYNKRREVPEEFIDFLMQNRDGEYEEYHGDVDSWYQ
ncbi:MAG TPA: hypothetical protein DHW49_05845 [Anaerolineae bacterium]|nr:hypothetical protein [Anaerolineae bacterium]